MGTEGDSFFVVFTSAQEAVLGGDRGAAGAGGSTTGPEGCRCGSGSGCTPVSRNGTRTTTSASTCTGLPGSRPPPMAVRSCCPRSTQELVGGGTADYRVRDLGWHRLKDLTEPEHLFDVDAPGLESEHPPLRSLGTAASLPTYATELVGRSREVAEICDMIDRGRRPAGDADRHRGDREDPAGRRGGRRAGAPARPGTRTSSPCTPTIGPP